MRALIEWLPENLALGVEMWRVLPLNRYAVEARYPDGWDPITRAEAEEAVAIAQEVREAVRRFPPLS